MADKKEELEAQRLARLEKERGILEGLMQQWDDPSMSKDISENSARDDLLERIKSQEQIVSKLELTKSVVSIPGTWNLGDQLYVKYIRIVCYGKDRDVPKGRVRIRLVDALDITTLKNPSIEDLEVVPTSINSPMGAALLHKAHDTVRFNTPVGYCEVEVERCLL